MEYFSFLYGGSPFLSSDGLKRETVKVSSTETKEIYTHPDGLTVTLSIQEYPKYNAKRWLIQFENNGKQDSMQLTDVFDANIVLDGYNARNVEKHASLTPDANCATVWHTVGSTMERSEFMAVEGPLTPGTKREYACTFGRSCNETAPYFDLNDGETGALIAIGWTGQWKSVFEAEGNRILFRAGVQDADFYLRPGEKIRTASILLMSYYSGRDNAHNQFRRLVKEHFSPIGKNGAPDHGPLSIEGWGSIHSELMIERIKRMRRLGLPADFYWIDAGWYGHSMEDCPDEFTGDWALHTGSWNVNPLPHPDSLKEVSKTARENGYGMLMWFEPERSMPGTDWHKEHPEWFLSTEPVGNGILLNLGSSEAWNAAFGMIDGYIKELSLGCYRQDYNMDDTLGCWRAGDEPGRRGLTEIHHIMGLYKLWDALLESNPGLLIDSCASGGRRNDIEIMSRSIPLWRSDAQCVGDRAPEVTQCHMTHYSAWLPYTGTGAGTVISDAYRLRSCYSPALMSGMTAYANIDKTDEELAQMKALFDEYLTVRPYLSCDFYDLAGDTLTDDAWCAWQFNRPEEKDGVILAFRRPQSPYETARLCLKGLKDDATYEIRDADTDEITLAQGNVLADFLLTIPEKRQSKLLFYRIV